MDVKVVLKDVEVDAAQVLSFLGKTRKAAPGAVAGLAVVLGAVGKAVSDVSAAAANPAQTLNVAFDLQTFNDLKTVWPDVKQFATELGIKLP